MSTCNHTFRTVYTPKNVNRPENERWQIPLLRACQVACLYCVRYLVESCNANVNIRNNYDRTALHMLCDKFFFQMVEDDNNQIVQGHESLRVPIVDYLLRHGACPNVQDMCTQTPIWLAICDNLRNIVRVLIDYGTHVDYCKDDQRIFPWVNALLRRKQCRDAIVILLGIRRFRTSLLDNNTKDVANLIAKVLWASR
jgi:ankyrin repeat protein